MSNIVLTKAEIEKYIKGLGCNLYDLYLTLDSIRFSEEDTLSDEFQIACEMLNVFTEYAKKSDLCTHGKGHCQCDNARCRNYCD